MPGKPFQCGAGAGGAAGVQQQPGPEVLCIQPVQNSLHFAVIIDAVGHGQHASISYKWGYRAEQNEKKNKAAPSGKRVHNSL